MLIVKLHRCVQVHEDTPDITPPSMEQLVEDGLTAMVAGSGTVCSALASLCSCVMAHPETYKKLQAEIDLRRVLSTPPTIETCIISLPSCQCLLEAACDHCITERWFAVATRPCVCSRQFPGVPSVRSHLTPQE